MKFNPRKSGKLLATVGPLLISSPIPRACSGGDSTETAGVGGTGIGIGGTGIVSGLITGFGSVHVNGGRFDIDTSQFNVDGDVNATQSNLALGMVVQLRVETENGAFTSNTLEVVYDDEIEGPITNIIIDPKDPTLKNGTIFGQMITFDETSTIFDANGNPNFDFGSLGNGDVVEVSGFRKSATDIAATYVRFIENLNLGTSEVELRGNIDQYTMGGSSFEINGTVINFDPTGITTDIDVPGGVISNGLYVEVEGVIQTATSVLADKIELEDENFDDDVDDISLQGVVVGFSGNLSDDFFIDNQLVNASTAQLSPASLTIENGLNIEVEGKIVGGKLIADEVELRDGESELKSFVSAINLTNGSFEVNYPPLLGSVVVNTSGQTLFDDEGPLQLPNLSLDLMTIGDFVEVKGIAVNGEITADIVKRKDSLNPDDSKIQGAVDVFLADTSITIFGITHNVDGGTDYEDTTGIVSSTIFFNQLQIGEIVEIKDDVTADGIADEVELE